MNLPQNVVWRLVLVGLMAGLGAGCGSLGKPYPDKHLYALAVGPAPASTQARSGSVLRVQTLRVATPFDATTFAYKTGELQFTTDYYRGFIAPPSQMLTSELSAWLSQAGPYACVLDGASTANYQLMLEGNVTAFYGDYSPGVSPQAVIEVKFFLIDTSSGQYRVLFQKVYRESEPLQGSTSEDLVAGWNRACGRVFGALANDLREAGAVKTGAL